MNDAVVAPTADLAVSTRTKVRLEIRKHGSDRYLLTSTVSYSFDRRIDADRFTLFATCSPVLRDALTAACDWPLVEYWFISDRAAFHDSVDATMSTIGLEVQASDISGRRRRAGVA